AGPRCPPRRAPRARPPADCRPGWTDVSDRRRAPPRHSLQLSLIGLPFAWIGPVPFMLILLPLITMLPLSLMEMLAEPHLRKICFAAFTTTFSVPASITRSLVSALMFTFSFPVIRTSFLDALRFSVLSQASRFRFFLALTLMSLFFASMSTFLTRVVSCMLHSA